MNVAEQTIDIRAESGGVEYTWPLTITESTGKDISADTVRLSLGTSTDPGTWLTPDVDAAQANHATRVVQLLVGVALRPVAGKYYLWSKVTDAPEVVPRRHQRITILADA